MRFGTIAGLSLILFVFVLGFQNCGQWSAVRSGGSLAASSIAVVATPVPIPGSFPTVTVTPTQVAATSVVFTDLDSVPTGTINGKSFFAYGTFQSLLQKTVSNKNGLFTAYLQSYQNGGGDGGDDLATWVVKRSVDGGATWSPILTHTDTGTKTPCLETNSAGDIFLAYPANHFQDAYFNKLLASENYTPAHTLNLPSDGAGKYSCEYDETAGIFYFLGWRNLARINPSTMTLIDQKQMFVSGPKGVPEYPHIASNADNSSLAIAWTTETPTVLGFGNGGEPYADIRFAATWDHGVTWGVPWIGNNLSLPITVDETGAAPRALVPGDYESIWTASAAQPAQNWLDSLMSVDGYLYFLYLHQSAGTYSTRLVRFNASDSTSQTNLLSLSGSTITMDSNGAFLAYQSASAGHILYAVGSTTDTRLGVLISRDDGTTWSDWAKSDVLSRPLYAVSGMRKVTSDGFIIGAYTESPLSGETSARVRFFKIKAL